MSTKFEIFPIGYIRKKEKRVGIEIVPEFSDALLGLEGFSHMHVLYWFHANDEPQKRNVLQVHPRKDKNLPLTGVFATHSPMRPNLVALSLCQIVSIKDKHICIDEIDAFDGSPVIDIKCYIPKDQPLGGLRLPDWA